MTKKANKTEVLVIDNNNLPAVPTMLEKLKEELNGLKAITETSYKTDGNVEGFGNIQNETKVENLIRAWSAVKNKANAYADAANDLGLSTFPAFKIGNSTPEAINHDIKLRMAVIKHADRKAELDALVKEGEKFLTEKDQYQIYLNKVAKATASL